MRRFRLLYCIGVERDVFMKVENARVAQTQNGSARTTAHELHNLIAVIIAEAQLLKLDCPTDAPNYRSAVAIERAGRRLETLLDRLPELRDVKAGFDTTNRNQAHSQETQLGRQEGIDGVIEGAKV